MKWDYHIVSDYSDSDLTLPQIFNQARSRGLSAIAITDRDRVEGALKACAAAEDLEVMHGIEVSAQDDQGHPVSVLGYAFDPQARALRHLCQMTLVRQNELALWQIEQLDQAGYPITVSEVRRKLGHGQCLYSQHIMDVLTEKGIADGLRGSFYRRYFGTGGLCQRSIRYPTVKEAIEAIHQDHGIAVLAHPGISGCIDQIWKWAEMGLDGVETGYSAQSFSQVMRIHEIAMALGLIETAGSGNRGRYGDPIPIGTVSWKGERLCRPMKN